MELLRGLSLGRCISSPFTTRSLNYSYYSRPLFASISAPAVSVASLSSVQARRIMSASTLEQKLNALQEFSACDVSFFYLKKAILNYTYSMNTNVDRCRMPC